MGVRTLGRVGFGLLCLGVTMFVGGILLARRPLQLRLMLGGIVCIAGYGLCSVAAWEKLCDENGLFIDEL